MLGPGGSSMNHKTFGNMIHPTGLVGCSLIKMSPVGSNEQYGDDLTACPPIIL